MSSVKKTIVSEDKFSDIRKSKKEYSDKYFIKDVENITGIKAFTLRIWEQRYNFLIPKRTETNIRYYEEADLKYIMNIGILNSNGYKISQIAKMSESEVQQLTLSISENTSENESQIQVMKSAMLDFNEREFNKILSISILKIGMEETMHTLVFPFLHHIGILWLSGSIHIAHEHFITNIIRQRLFVSIDQLSPIPSIGSKKFLLFVPAGENHEISILYANFILRSYGQEVIYLGNSMPMDDLHQLMNVHIPDYLFCSITGSNQQIPVQVYIQTLSRNWPNTSILLTGSQVVKKKDLRLPSNCSVISTPEELHSFIQGHNQNG